MNVGGVQIDAAVAVAFLAALAPAGLTAALQATEELEADHETTLTQFKRDVERAKALGVRIQLSQGRQPAGRVFWLDGYRQLTGYSTKNGGEPFTHPDAVANIDKALTEIEDDRALIAERQGDSWQ